MKQTFDIRGGAAMGRANLPTLRQKMSDLNLDFLYVPHEDEYNNEYLPEAYQRLTWLTGFTGSAGCAVIGIEAATVFVDGRYTLQAADQLDDDLFAVKTIQQPANPFGWLAAQNLSGKTLGYDPKLSSPNDVAALAASVAKAGGTLKMLDANPIDAAWDDQPPPPIAPIVPQPLEYTGMAAADKRVQIAETLSADKADAAIITAPASLAWAFNMRGGDVMCTPLPLGRAILHKDATADLFLAEAKVSDGLREHLGNGVRLHKIEALESELAKLSGKTISIDPNMASAWFFETLKNAGASILAAQDPCALPKACKNPAEIAGTQTAHIRDGAALTRFLHWLDTHAQSGEVTEIEAVTKLEHLRDATGKLNDLSFETISGAGPNGAIVHYRVSTATDRKLERGSLFLVDSGGQYLDGTTDVTRTVAIGSPTDEMRTRYTQVLKGHIALAVVRFPPGTTGTHLDILARHALWQAGVDYGHGTGHGVGVYLGVHEGPQRIAKAWNAVPLAPGMIMSNEPGYYKAEAFGIRIENLQFVTEPEAIAGGEIDMLGFENLTWAPLARTLIDISLLSDTELSWVNNYHATVLEKLTPHLNNEPDVLTWLGEACAPV
ncbi:MAG: aminopeptidase P family protein [Hyphomonadaceae bacterium]